MIGLLAFLTLSGIYLYQPLTAFSDFSATITMAGVNVTNAKVTRKICVKWDDQCYTDETKPDKNGKFEFSKKTVRMPLANILPHEVTISQEILIEHNGASYLAWQYNKRNYDNGSELGDQTLKLKCELKTEPQHFGVGGVQFATYDNSKYTAKGICRF